MSIIESPNFIQKTEPSICGKSLLKPKPHQVFSLAHQGRISGPSPWVLLDERNISNIPRPEMRISHLWNVLECGGDTFYLLSLHGMSSQRIQEYPKTGDTWKYPPRIKKVACSKLDPFLLCTTYINIYIYTLNCIVVHTYIHLYTYM